MFDQTSMFFRPSKPHPFLGWIFFIYEVAEVPEEVHGRRSSKDRHGFVDAEGLACAGHADDLHLGANDGFRGQKMLPHLRCLAR